ncbi:MAG TPA: hypothetical protein VM597_19845 [Gemmataceae bacterium]|nr:hypothetical protein [Gemmataceae bacterium]
MELAAADSKAKLLGLFDGKGAGEAEHRVTVREVVIETPREAGAYEDGPEAENLVVRCS